MIELHKDSLKHSKNDTHSLLETFQSTEKVEAKLKHSFFNMEDDMDFVKEILNEEHKFQMENKVVGEYFKVLEYLLYYTTLLAGP